MVRLLPSFINLKILATESTEDTEKTRAAQPDLPSLDNARGAVPLLRRLDVSIKPGGVGEDCLSAKREFRSRPDLSANRGKSEGPVQWGALLFGSFLLGKQEKGTCRRATPGLTKPMNRKCWIVRRDPGF